MFRRLLSFPAIVAALASSVAPGIADLHLPRDIKLDIFDRIRERPTSIEIFTAMLNPASPQKVSA